MAWWRGSGEKGWRVGMDPGGRRSENDEQELTLLARIGAGSMQLRSAQFKENHLS